MLQVFSVLPQGGIRWEALTTHRTPELAIDTLMNLHVLMQVCLRLENLITLRAGVVVGVHVCGIVVLTDVDELMLLEGIKRGVNLATYAAIKDVGLRPMSVQMVAELQGLLKFLAHDMQVKHLWLSLCIILCLIRVMRSLQLN